MFGLGVGGSCSTGDLCSASICTGLLSTSSSWATAPSCKQHDILQTFLSFNVGITIRYARVALLESNPLKSRILVRRLAVGRLSFCPVAGAAAAREEALDLYRNPLRCPYTALPCPTVPRCTPIRHLRATVQPHMPLHSTVRRHDTPHTRPLQRPIRRLEVCHRRCAMAGVRFSMLSLR